MSNKLKICPVCKEAGEPAIETIYAESVHWRVWCQNCGVVFVDMRAWQPASPPEPSSNQTDK